MQARGGGRLDLRAGATRAATKLASLDGGTLLLVSGAVSTWIRVHLPDGTVGYVARQSVVAADTPLQRPRVAAGSVLHQRPLDAATPVGTLDLAQQVDVLGRFGDYDFVRTSKGETGWLRRG